MEKVSIGRLFSATWAFIAARWALILGTMVGAVLLCGVIGFALLGSTIAQLMGAAVAGGQPDPGLIFQAMGSILLFVLLLSIILYGAYFLIWRVALSNPARGIGESFGWSMLAGLTTTGAVILLSTVAYIALILVLLVIGLIFGGSMMAMGATDPENAAGAAGGFLIGIVVFYIALLGFMLWIGSRLIATGAVMAAQNTVNPFRGIVRSWRLTSASQWSIFGFLLIAFIVYLVAIFGISMITGLAIRPNPAEVGQIPGTRTIVVSVVLWLAVYIPSLLFYAAAPVAAYRELSGSSAASLGDTFD